MKTLKIILLIIINCLIIGCGGSLLTKKDISTLEGHSKYPLYAAVIINNIKDLDFRLRGKELIKRSGDGAIGFNLYGSSRDFFPRIFEHVDFVDENKFYDPGKYDLIVRFNRISASDNTNRKDKVVSVRLNICVEFKNPAGEIILQKDVSSSETVFIKDRSTNALFSGYIKATFGATRNVFRSMANLLSSRPNSLDKYTSYLALQRRDKKDTRDYVAPDILASEMITVVIDDKDLKGYRKKVLEKKDLVKIVNKLKKSMSKQFKKIEVREGYNEAKPGEIIIKLQRLLIKESGLHYNTGLDFTIKIGDENLRVFLDGEGIYKVSLPQAFINAVGAISLVGIPLVLGEQKLLENIAFGRSLESLASKISTYIISAPGYKRYARSVKMMRTAEADLKISIIFSDSEALLPNQCIDAGENFFFDVSLTNKGKGIAFDVNLGTESKYKNLTFPKTISVGDIQPGESKNLTIPIKADLPLATGTASFLIRVHEKRGYDARPVELQIPTAELRSPRLLFASCNLNDSSGLASGDADGIAENNETIELNPYINNDGVGDALKISVKLTGVTEGIEIIKGSDQLASIAPGTIGKATLVFKISRTFCQPEIKYTIAATDVRGMETEKTYTIPFQSKTPILYYTYQVVDSRNRKIPGLENGKSYSLRITPKNTGSNIAEGVNVRVSLESSKVIVGSYDGNIGILQPDSVGSVITVPISLNRSFVDNALSLKIDMTQNNFPGLSREITLPVMVKKPNLEYQIVLLNGISDKKLSQNSWPRFRVSVSNNGNLDARDVRIRFHVSDVGITFDKEEMIGTINAGESQYKDFTFFVRGDAPVGEMPVKVRITQADFDDISTTIAYRLTKQTAIVQRVEATGGGSGRYASATYSGPPELYVNSPNKDTKTYKETIDLHGSVMTFGPGNAVQSLTITLNDEPLKIISVMEDIRFDTNQITRRSVEANKTVFDGVIALKPGTNVVKTTCADRNGQRSKQSVRIVKKAKLGDIYAVVVGISKFHNPGCNLNYAASDAKKFYDFLRSESGGELPEKRVRLLADSSATRANVIGTLTNLLGRATKEDTVEIYIATHGITGFDGTLYYLCYDTDIENLRGTGFSDRDLTDILNKNIAAGKIIIYLDACHSGLSGLSERYAKRGIGVYEVNERINSLAGALSKTAVTGVVTFSASSSTGYSLEDPKWKGGVFTHCLVNGLQGEANGNNDEWVSVNELDNYLVRKVMALTDGKQRPKVNGTLMGDTPLSKVR